MDVIVVIIFVIGFFMKEFTWQVRIYYEDTDAGGIVYHARYLNFYERARTEMLRGMAINQDNLLQENIAFVVKQIAIDYINIARLDELLTVHTQALFVKKASLTCKQMIVNQNEKLINQANVVIACIDTSKMKPIVFPQNIVTEFTL